MNNIFEHSNSTWVRYSDYELKKDKNDIVYVVPKKDAVPELYNPIKDAEQLVIDAINIGTMCIGKEAAKRIEMAVMDFVKIKTQQRRILYGLFPEYFAVCEFRYQFDRSGC